MDRNFDVSVEQALDFHNLSNYLALPEKERNRDFDQAMGLRSGMTDEALKALIAGWYQKTGLSDTAKRMAWLEQKPTAFTQSDDPFIKAAATLFATDMKKEAADEELGGQTQQAYANYMRAKIAFMNSQGKAVYPDANSTLRVTFGNVKGRGHGADGTAWTAFTSLRGITAKATGEGEFNAPQNQLAAIKSKTFGDYYEENE